MQNRKRVHEKRDTGDFWGRGMKGNGCFESGSTEVERLQWRGGLGDRPGGGSKERVNHKGRHENSPKKRLYTYFSVEK